ncbi:MarR family winged helix-turn-helix transcriptional regulator [Streptomyces boluensis]|uniref:MarR family transcriptional regulator n=1 Tax=Streptomyces boluensis TaxID=1775135 RepID=A0A964UUI0_9ACTN|nr:MarR family transcriptional regulator [Streptomyces boluensis]NBE53162.1 MarR family transcriptional regulator [Streptomyces boluensis]
MPKSPRVDPDQLLELFSVSFGAYYGDFTAAAARENLTASQGKTLGELSRGPVAMRGLADTLACDASNITGIIDRLEKRGLVRREPSPGDRRVKNVVLTPEGEQAVEAIRAHMDTTRAGMDTLDAEERATLHALLKRVFTARCGES